MLSETELERYKRQIMIFGKEGQEKLKSAEIFIAGAGGLGSPVAYYLAAAGVGRLVIADSDKVELTNLNRQILHTSADIGIEKAKSAREKLLKLNPEIEIETRGKIDETSAKKFAENADGIVDALDNFSTRYILNETALDLKIPLFHGGISGYNGQATTIIPDRTGCLACLFPKMPAEETAPVIGTTPGIIGLIQANEVIKYITGKGTLLENRLFIWNGLESRSEEIRFSKNEKCKVCSK